MNTIEKKITMQTQNVTHFNQSRKKTMKKIKKKRSERK